MEEIMGLMVEEINYVRITIPPGVYTSFKGVSEVDSLIANCATLPHDSQECDSLDPFTSKIPYQWND